MLSLLILAAAYLGIRALTGALRNLPRSNDDMIFY